MLLAKTYLKDDPSGREQMVNPEEMNDLDAATREYLERALKVDEDDAVTLYEMAQYWQDIPGQEQKVEDLFLRGVFAYSFSASLSLPHVLPVHSTRTRSQLRAVSHRLCAVPARRRLESGQARLQARLGR